MSKKWAGKAKKTINEDVRSLAAEAVELRVVEILGEILLLDAGVLGKGDFAVLAGADDKFL